MPYEIRTGKDPNKGKVDGVIRIDSQSLVEDYWFDPTPGNRFDEQVPADKYDAYSILLHEMGHILGISGWRDDITGQPSGNDLSRFDQLMSFDADGTPYFNGAMAKAAYGNQPVPLTYENIHHVGNDTIGSASGLARPGSDLVEDVMSGVGAIWGTRRQLSPLDTAILKDIGLPVVRAANTAPVLADVVDRVMAAGDFLEVPVTISDRETPADGLVLTVSTDRPELSSRGGLFIRESGSLRTLVIEPPDGFRGGAVITLALSDGTQTVTDKFSLTVRANHRPPEISAYGAAFFDEDTVHLMQIFITPGDLPIDVSSARATSTNTTLFPPGSLSLDKHGDGWSVTMRPAANRNKSLDGVGIVELSISDGVVTVTKSIEVTVQPINDRPVITALSDVVIPTGGSRQLSVVINDADTLPENLIVTAFAADGALFSPRLLPVQRLGGEYHVTLSPQPGMEGITTIELAASDGQAITVQTFGVQVTSNVFPWHNASSPFDVNKDGAVTMLDALTVINTLTQRGPGPLNSGAGAVPLANQVDVEPDNELKASDALLVINYVNERNR